MTDKLTYMWLAILLVFLLLYTPNVNDATAQSRWARVERTHTVSDVRRNAAQLYRLRSRVHLQGRILHPIRKTLFEFTDNTGSMRIRMRDRSFVFNPNATRTVFEISGVVRSRSMREPVLDVTRVTESSN